MKTKQITIRLTVPDWFPGPAYWHRVKVTWKTLKYKLRPCHCVDCNTRLDYKSPEYCYSGDKTHKRVLLSCSINKIAGPQKGLCGECLSKRIRALFARIKSNRGTQRNGLNHTGTKKAECDCCGIKKATIDVSWDPDCDIRFGSQWWNGHKMCEDCLCLAAEKGQRSSGHSMWVAGVGVNINHAGAAIGLEHWYDLLLPTKRKKDDENRTES